MAIEYFCCYHSYRMKIAKLSDQEVGRLFRSLLEYSETGETQELTGREAVAFDFIAYDIEQSKKAYAERCRTNAENGKTGGRPKKRELSEKPNGFSETQKSQTKTKTKTETNPPNGGEKRLSRFRPRARKLRPIAQSGGTTWTRAASLTTTSPTAGWSEKTRCETGKRLCAAGKGASSSSAPSGRPLMSDTLGSSRN